MITGCTLFSGGRTVEAALPEVEFIGAVEIDPIIAAHPTHRNLNCDMKVADVSDVDYRPWRGVDYLHASPSCKQASIANKDRGETEEDRQAARAVCRAIAEIMPPVFTLENVSAYQTFDSFLSILAALANHGYTFDFDVYNSADFGTPQTRKRLYLRAWRCKKALPAVIRTHASRGALGKKTFSIFDDYPLPWNGWYHAIEDLIPTLIPSEFAEWQLKRLPKWVTESLLVYIDSRPLSRGKPRRSRNRSQCGGREDCLPPHWGTTHAHGIRLLV